MASDGRGMIAHSSCDAIREMLSFAGPRPSFMKIASIVDAMKSFPDLQHRLVHSGQHCDELLWGSFFAVLRSKHHTRPRDNSNRIWRLFSLELWFGAFVDHDSFLLRAGCGPGWTASRHSAVPSS